MITARKLHAGKNIGKTNLNLNQLALPDEKAVTQQDKGFSALRQRVHRNAEVAHPSLGVPQKAGEKKDRRRAFGQSMGGVSKHAEDALNHFV
ncbi:hypothetical protein [Pseudomonas bubulae]|uniref:hypothetical protein n=1 Tax=Pseudomonas bubulae TaxID=2316085 RepID=UPI001F36D078|nr:hypothetical protein [Pseudomonas bubulae]MCF3193402.1 hypothetical protein [Pseudomonas bubulae]